MALPPGVYPFAINKHIILYYPVPRSRMNGVIPLLHLCAFMVWTGTALPFTFYSAWRFTPIPILNLYLQVFCNTLSIIRLVKCGNLSAVPWREEKCDISVQGEIQSRRYSVTRSKTERTLQTLRPPHSRIQLQGVFYESSSLSNFPHSTLNICVLLLHVNWLQLKFTYTHGYNGVFLTALHFTELLAFFSSWRYIPHWGLYFTAL